MVKPKEQVIEEFNIQVNMSIDELQAWLENPQSKKAGTGVGIESGHKIVEILKKNPEKDPAKYDEEDIEHMRKVVGYNNRHIAQEDHLKETKTTEELENTKSTISMKNWGHDPIKTLGDEEAAAKETPEAGPASEAPQEPSKGVQENDDKQDEGEDTHSKPVGFKRKLDETDPTAEDNKDTKGAEASESKAGPKDDKPVVENGDDEADGHVRKKSRSAKEAEAGADAEGEKEKTD